MPRRPGRRGGRRYRVLTALSCVTVAVALLPVGYLFVRASELGVADVLAEFAGERIARLAATSLALAAVVTAGSVILAVLLAFLVTRTDVPARRVIAVLAALPLAVPSYVAAFSWVAAGDALGVTVEGFTASCLVLVLYTYPYAYLSVVAVLARTDPAQEEVAQAAGRGPWRTFCTVTLAQVSPAIGAGALLVASYVLSDFGAVSILRLDTFTRAVFTALQVGFDRTGALALSLGLLVATALLLTCAHLMGRRAARHGVPEGRTPRPQPTIPLGAWRIPALCGVVLVLGAALGVPAWTLLRWTAAGVSEPGRPLEIAETAATTLGFGLAGGGIVVLLALPVGVLLARTHSGLARFLERLTYLAHSLPGVVIGLSLVSFGIAVVPGLYQRLPILLLGYATLFLPLGIGPVTAAAGRAAPLLTDMAQSLGVPPWSAWRRVTLPLVLPGLGAGSALAVLAVMKELPATLLLRPTGTETLATRLWSHTDVGAYAAAAPYAALLVVLAAVPTSVFVLRSGVLAATTPRRDRPALPSGGVR